MKGESAMTTLEKLEELKAKVKSYAILGHESAWNDAQEWRRQAKYAIETIFEGVRARTLLDRIRRLFNTGFIASANMGPLITETDEEIEDRFQRDITSAEMLMDECTRMLQYSPRMLQEEFGQGVEVCQGETGDVVSTANSVTSPIRREALSRSSSKALDTAMDAENSRFAGTKFW